MFSRLKRVGIGLGKGLGFLVGFAVFLVAAALLGLQTPWAQHHIAKFISQQADKSIQGRVEVTLDGSLSLVGLSGVSVRLLPQDVGDDTPLAEVSNIRAGWDLWSLLESLLGSGPLVIGIEHVEMESVFVDLRSDPNGQLALVEAVTPVPPSEPQPESTGPSPYVNLETLRIFDTRILMPQEEPAADEPVAPLRQTATIDRVHATFDMRNGMFGTVALSSVEVPIPGQPSVFFGDLGASGYMDENEVATANAIIEGQLQGLPVTIEGNYHDEEWVAHVDVDGSAEAWQGAVPGFEPTQAVAVAVAAVGDSRSADVRATVSAGRSRIATIIELAFTPLTASGVLSMQSVNPRTFAAAAPPGVVNVTAGFSGRTEPQSAELRLAIRASELEGNAIPDFDLHAEAIGQATGGQRVNFQLRAVDDSGLKLEGHVNNRPEAVSFEVNGQAKRLPEYPGAPQLSAFEVRGLTLDAQGTLQNEPQTLSASVQMYVDRIRIPSAKVEVADLSAQLATSGPLAAPVLDGDIVAHAVRVGDVSASHLRLQATSSAPGQSKLLATTRARLTKDAAPRDISISTELTSFSPLTARGTSLKVASKKHTLLASVGALHMGAKTSVQELRVSGVGEVTGHATLNGSSVDAAVQMRGLDASALSELFAPLVPPLTGNITANVAMKSKGERLASAYVFARARDLGTDAARADELEASLVVEEDILSGTVTVLRGESGLRVDTQAVDVARLRQPVPPGASIAGFLAKSFRGYAVTTIHANSDDFPELEQALGEVHASGVLQSQVIVHQRDDMPLALNTVVKLRDVDIRKVEPSVPPEGSGQGEAANPEGATSRDPAWEVTGLTADWSSVYDGANGQWSNSLSASDRNRSSPMARVSFDTTLRLDLLNEPLATLLPTLPLEGSLAIPSTPLDSLPGGSALPTGLEGSIAAQVEFSGTVSSPNIEGSLQVKDLQVSSSNNSFPISIAIDATASKQAIDAGFEVTHDALVLATGNVRGAPASNEWRAEAKIDKLPIGRMPYVRDYGVTGFVSGDFSFDSVAGNPSVAAKIEAKDIQAYSETIRKMLITVKLAEGNGELVAELEQRSGSARLEAVATSSTGQLGDYRPSTVRLTTRSFEIRPFLIAMQDSVSDLSGTLDGVVEVAFEPGSTQATGEIGLSDGLVLVPALGKQVHDIQMTVRAAPGKLELSRLDAKVERGAISGAGNLAYTQEGRFLAELNLRLPDGKRLPIANKGRNVAEASGRIDIQASAGPNQPLKVNVEIPELDVHFSDSATDKVMASESPSFVALGTYLPDGHYVRFSGKKQTKESTAAEETKPTRITVNLGKKVWLHHGKSTFAGIHGNIEAHIGETTKLLGTLNLAEGRIDIQGRVFDIRPGTVTFRGDTPPNPDVVAEAAWSSPSGHTVVAAYRGSVNNGKVILRSEPPLSYGEILNVLLFDDPEGSGGSDGSPGAGDVAATVASAGLSKSLTSLTDLDIQANIDTDAAGSPRPELGVRLSPRLAVEVAYVLEPSAVLSQPPDRVFVTFDWRLSNAWTLETTLGDHGSAATDVTWKYRY